MQLREYLKYTYLKARFKRASKYSLFNDGDLKNSPFFILASGRSGTTLLRTILSRNPTVTIPPESNDLIPIWITQFIKSKNESWEDVVQALLDKVNKNNALQFWNLDISELQQKLMDIPEKERSLHKAVETMYKMNHDSAMVWGDKTPYLIFALPYLSDLFPQAKFVFLIRDGRDVIRSRMEARLDATLENSIDRWIKASKIIEHVDQTYKKMNFKLVRYEDLVTNTEEVVQSICQFLSIDFELGMLDQSNTLDLGDTKLAHHKNTKRPIDARSIGKWKSYFSDEQKIQLHQSLGKLLDYFDYSKNELN